MDQLTNNYLEKVEKYLKLLPVSERIDIVQEIKSQMIELETKNGLSPDKIIERLGDPKELAKGYLGESISKSNSFSWKRLKAVLGFYCYAGVTGMFVLPVISVLAVAFMISGVLSPIAGVIKLVGFLLGFDISLITVQIGAYSAGPIEALPITIVTGLLFFWLGKGFWNLTIKYIKSISERKKVIL